MTRIRRGLLLLALTGSVVVGASAMAQAAFGDSASMTTGAVTTPTVAAPGNVVGSLACASPAATMSVTWEPSTSARVTGYLVTVYYSDGIVQTAQKAATDTSWSASTNLFYVTANSVQYSVTTLTDYGWTKASARTGTFRC